MNIKTVKYQKLESNAYSHFTECLNTCFSIIRIAACVQTIFIVYQFNILGNALKIKPSYTAGVSIFLA